MWLSNQLVDPASQLPGTHSSVLAAPVRLLDTGGFLVRQEQAPHRMSQPPRLEGVCNFRQSPGEERVSGVRQPSAAGVPCPGVYGLSRWAAA